MNDEASAKMALGDIAPEAVFAARDIAPERPGLAVAGDTSGGWSRIRTPFLSLADAAAVCRETVHLVPDLSALASCRPAVPLQPTGSPVPLVKPVPDRRIGHSTHPRTACTSVSCQLPTLPCLKPEGAALSRLSISEVSALIADLADHREFGLAATAN